MFGSFCRNWIEALGFWIVYLRCAGSFPWNRNGRGQMDIVFMTRSDLTRGFQSFVFAFYRIRFDVFGETQELQLHSRGIYLEIILRIYVCEQ